MFCKTSCIPLFHLDHGVVIVGQGLFGSYGGYPGVYGLPVFFQQLIKVFGLHGSVNVWQPTATVNGAGDRFTKD